MLIQKISENEDAEPPRQSITTVGGKTMAVPALNDIKLLRIPKLALPDDFSITKIPL